MSEYTQAIMMFFLTIIILIGIVSVVVCYSKDRINFNIKAHTKLPNDIETDFNIELTKENKIESK